MCVDACHRVHVGGRGHLGSQLVVSFYHVSWHLVEGRHRYPWSYHASATFCHFEMTGWFVEAFTKVSYISP